MIISFNEPIDIDLPYADDDLEIVEL